MGFEIGQRVRVLTLDAEWATRMRELLPGTRGQVTEVREQCDRVVRFLVDFDEPVHDGTWTGTGFWFEKHELTLEVE